MSETFGQALRRHRTQTGLSQTALAQHAHLGQSDISRYERDVQHPTPSTADMLDKATAADGYLHARVTAAGPRAESLPRGNAPSFGDELAAVELARRVEACDVGAETLQLLEQGFDQLATAYPTAIPEQLLPRLRDRLGYVQHLLEVGRLNLTAHRHLVVLGAWYSLLTATVLIDQETHEAATAHLRTADTLAAHAEQPEIRAWCCETEAWRQLTTGNARKAAHLSQRAQQLAPARCSAAIQATAQEGRAHARLGNTSATYRAVETVHALAEGLDRQHELEHHYQYDTGKVASYTATTLAWLGSPEGIHAARSVIERFRPNSAGQPWPRRYALGHVDLALGSARQGEHEQAVDSVRTALDSGAIVPSNYWRVAEVLRELAAAQVPAAGELQAAYRNMTATPATSDAHAMRIRPSPLHR